MRLQLTEHQRSKLIKHLTHMRDHLHKKDDRVFEKLKASLDPNETYMSKEDVHRLEIDLPYILEFISYTFPTGVTSDDSKLQGIADLSSGNIRTLMRIDRSYRKYISWSKSNKTNDA